MNLPKTSHQLNQYDTSLENPNSALLTSIARPGPFPFQAIPSRPDTRMTQYKHRTCIRGITPLIESTKPYLDRPPNRQVSPRRCAFLFPLEWTRFDFQVAGLLPRHSVDLASTGNHVDAQSSCS